MKAPPKPAPGRRKHKPGKKKLGESALSEMLKDADENPNSMRPEMLALIDLANRKGWDAAQLCREADNLDQSSFRKSAFAKNPHKWTIKRLATALNLPPIVARALLTELSDYDVQALTLLIVGEVSNRKGGTFVDANIASRALLDFLTDNADAQRAAAGTFALAINGLRTKFEPVLGHALGTVELVVRPCGFSLMQFVADRTSIEERLSSGRSWQRLLCKHLGLSREHEVAIARILAQYDPSILNNEGEPPARSRAEDAAEAAYWSTYRSEFEGAAQATVAQKVVENVRRYTATTNLLTRRLERIVLQANNGTIPASKVEAALDKVVADIDDHRARLGMVAAQLAIEVDRRHALKES